MEHIFLKLDYQDRCWSATFYADADGTPNPEIMSTFGTCTIPTAFTLQAPAAKVLAEIRRLNPAAAVFAI